MYITLALFCFLLFFFSRYDHHKWRKFHEFRETKLIKKRVSYTNACNTLLMYFFVFEMQFFTKMSQNANRIFKSKLLVKKNCCLQWYKFFWFDVELWVIFALFFDFWKKKVKTHKLQLQISLNLAEICIFTWTTILFFFYFPFLGI